MERSDKKSRGFWGTDREIKFINRMGDWNEDGRVNRMKALKGYRDSMRKRQHWGDINRDQIEKYIDDLIQIEETYGKKTIN